MRPVRATALYLVRYFKAFALSGRQVTVQNKNPGRCPGLRASAPSGRAAVGCLTIRACCLYGLLGLQGASLIALYPGRCPGLRASALSGRAAVGCLTIRACCFYGLLGLQGDAVMGFWACCLYGLLALWALLSHANFAEFSSCMVEITLHALLYG